MEDKNDTQKQIKKSFIKKNYLKKIVEFASILFIAAVFALLIKSFVIEAYKIPTSSMRNTLLPGDFIIVNKLAYGGSLSGTIPFINITLPHISLPGYTKPEINDIIVFKFPGYRDELHSSRDVNYIKRVYGLPGDTIEIIRKKVFVNGEEINPPPLGLINIERIRSRDEASEKIFPKGKYWNEDYYGPLVVPRKGLKILLNPYNIEQWKIIINREYDRAVVSLNNGKIFIDGVESFSYTFKENYYFVLGDNRDDSMDSRFWGLVPEKNLIGRAAFVYWSAEPDSSGFFSGIRYNRILSNIK